MRVAVGVPVMNNFKGLAELTHSLWDQNVGLYVFNNWEENHGVSRAWNEITIAAVKSGIDFLVICNDDIVWRPNSFYKLKDAWINRPEGTSIVTGVAHDVAPGYHEAPDYSCFGFNPLEMVLTIGYFDENFTPAYFEDNDSHYRIKLAGRKAYCYSEARVDHKGSQTQNADPKKPVVTSKMFEANRDYYSRKWGGWPGNEKYQHPYNDEEKDWKYWHDR